MAHIANYKIMTFNPVCILGESGPDCGYISLAEIIVQVDVVLLTFQEHSPDPLWIKEYLSYTATVASYIGEPKLASPSGCTRLKYCTVSDNLISCL